MGTISTQLGTLHLFGGFFCSKKKKKLQRTDKLGGGGEGEKNPQTKSKILCCVGNF